MQKYGIVGTSELHVIAPGLEHLLPAGAMPVTVERPAQNAVLQEDGSWIVTVDSQLAAIEEQYEARLGSIRTARDIADLAGGPNREAKLASLSAEWQAVTSEKAAALMAVMEGI